MKLTLRNSWKLLLGFLLATLLQSSSFGLGDLDPNSNLLTNGDFKKGMQGWELLSFGKQGQTTVIQPGDVLVDGLRPQSTEKSAPDPTDIHDGKPSLRIENIALDDTAVKQTVKVKPATRYRLSGWVKTKNVEAKKMTGKPPGASLCVMGGFEKTESIIRTKGWTHLTFEFSSGTRSEVTVAARIGHYASPVKGIGWFSDMMFVELGH